MPRRTIVDITEFQRRVSRGHKPGVAVRFATDAQIQVSDDSRAVTFVFSDGSVDRYGDTIDARGWQLDNFNANPVALFGHDSGSVENVIGRAKNLRVDGNRLVGDIEFMEASVNPNAEVVFQMVKAGFLRAVSVGFQPLDWVTAKDKARPGGIDFRKQDLLEISIVPIPANANALVQAKAAGIEIERLGLVVRDLPNIAKKGLFEVSWLAGLLGELGYLADCVAWEAEYEGDGSEVPASFAAALNALGQVLLDMTAEEVAELLAGDDDEDPVLLSVDPVETAGLTPAQKALSRFAAIGRRARQPRLAPAPIEPEIRAGKVLSATNEKTLRDAHASISTGCEMIMGVVGATAEAESDEPDDDVTKAALAKAARDRRDRIARAHGQLARAV